MSHVRQQIRDAAVTALTGLATTGSRVFASRKRPVGDAKLPCLLVFTDEERIDAASVHNPAVLDRRLELRVVGLTKDTTDLDDALDTMAAEVETVLGGASLGGLCKSLTLSGIQVDLDESLEKPVGQIALTFEANYFTVANAPAIAI